MKSQILFTLLLLVLLTACTSSETPAVDEVHETVEQQLVDEEAVIQRGDGEQEGDYESPGATVPCNTVTGQGCDVDTRFEQHESSGQDDIVSDSHDTTGGNVGNGGAVSGSAASSGVVSGSAASGGVVSGSAGSSGSMVPPRDGPVGSEERPPTPPVEAYAACDGKRVGFSCDFNAPHGEVTGECMTFEDDLVCGPTGGAHPPL
jgi:hypothetical protein